MPPRNGERPPPRFADDDLSNEPPTKALADKFNVSRPRSQATRIPRSDSRRDRDPVRAYARARFIITTAREAGVQLALVGRTHDCCAFAHAPTALTQARRLACQASFRRAIREELFGIVALVAARGRLQ
jgi:hypothetical protein